MNVSVTDVAWGLPQSYITTDDEHTLIHVGIGGVSPDGVTINSTEMEPDGVTIDSTEMEHTVMDSSGKQQLSQQLWEDNACGGNGIG